jgi:hypothetical protein
MVDSDSKVDNLFMNTKARLPQPEQEPTDRLNNVVTVDQIPQTQSDLFNNVEENIFKIFEETLLRLEND